MPSDSERRDATRRHAGFVRIAHPSTTGKPKDPLRKMRAEKDRSTRHASDKPSPS